MDDGRVEDRQHAWLEPVEPSWALAGANWDRVRVDALERP
jgi:hypothetical protein